MPCRHGETGIRNRLKIGLFGLRVRFPLAALLETRHSSRVSLFFQRFPHGSHITPIHSKSRHFSIKRGQNVGTESPDHRQVEAFSRPLLYGEVLLVVAKQQQETGVLAERSGFQLLDHTTLL